MKVIYNGQIDSRLMKDVINNTLKSRLDRDTDAVYLDADLMSCIGMGSYARQHPLRAINCGIAEQNMVGIACGMASMGFKPVIHSFGTFASRRCFDQAFLSGGYAKNDITIMGSDPGITAVYNGGTHMPFEDMALYRAIPGATVIDISDTSMCESVLDQCFDYPGLKYVRLTRKPTVALYAPGEKFEIGKALVLRDGCDVTLVACGIMVAEAMKASLMLEKEGISAAVIDMFTVKPLDEALLIEFAKRTGAVVSCENHNMIGGLHSAVTALLSENLPVPVGCVAVKEAFGEVGSLDYLRNRFKLTAEEIILQAKRVIGMKK